MDTLYHANRKFKSTKKKILPEKRNQILITEVIYHNEPRYRSPKAEQAKKEISNLVRRVTWEIVSKDEVPDNANIIGGRFVMEIKTEKLITNSNART